MPKPHDRDPLFETDYHFLLADDHGRRHDVGPLVEAVLSLHRDHPTRVEAMTEVSEGTTALVQACIEAGIETGIKLAVLKLYGDEAAAAFSDYIDEVERSRAPGTA